MAVQYDFQPGFDLSSLSSATQAQVMQALSQMEPLSNIGGIYYGTTAPDTANNPRFIRYLWIDITDLTNLVIRKYDNGSWNAYAPSNASILAAMLANYAVSVLRSDNTTSKIALRPDASADLTKANYILRVDPTGIFIEPVTLDTLLAAGTGIGLNRISVTGGSDYDLLSIVGGVLAYRAFDATNTLNDNSVPPAKLSNTTAYFVLAANASGVITAQQFDPANMISATDADRIALNKLKRDTAVANDQIKCDGTNWVIFTPPFNTRFDSYTMQAADLLSGTAAAAGSLPAVGNFTVYRKTHGLGAVPKLVRAVGLCTSSDHGFAINDEVELAAFSATSYNPIIIQADATYVSVIAHASNAIQLATKGGPVTAATNIDATKWGIKVTAWV